MLKSVLRATYRSVLLVLVGSIFILSYHLLTGGMFPTEWMEFQNFYIYPAILEATKLVIFMWVSLAVLRFSKAIRTIEF